MPQIQCPTCLASGKDTSFDVTYGFHGKINCHECGTTLEVGDNNNNIRYNIWIYLLIAAILPISATHYIDLFNRIENNLPNCGSSQATDIVMSIIEQNKHSPPAHGFNESSYKIQYIHTTDVNSETGARSCAGSLYARKLQGTELEYANRITWSIHHSEDGDDGIVVHANW